jgi:N-methylhydantoinase A/oxoprolinase/acetone carboxylase beta subunit
MATFQRPKIVLTSQEKSTETAQKAALLSTGKAYFGGGEADDMPVFDGDKLKWGMTVPGPALVVLPDTTIVVPPFAVLETREYGYFVMNVDTGVKKSVPKVRERELAMSH